MGEPRGLATKIGRNGNGDIAGYCGALVLGQRWLKAFMSDADELPSVASSKGDDSALILIARASGYVEILESDGYLHYEAPFYALGSGASYALAAMEAGASAKRAIEIASKYDPGTNNLVDTLKL